MYNLTPELAALEKLAGIVLCGARPSKVEAWEIYNAYRNCTLEHEILEKKELSGPIKAIKLHKNRKIYLWFESEEDARKVAEVLIYGSKTVQTQC